LAETFGNGYGQQLCLTTPPLPAACKIGDAGAALLATVLSKNRTLQKLELQSKRTAAVLPLTPVTVQMPHVTLTPCCCIGVLRAVCDIGPKGADKLVGALENNRTLHSLGLGGEWQVSPQSRSAAHAAFATHAAHAAQRSPPQRPHASAGACNAGHKPPGVEECTVNVSMLPLSAANKIGASGATKFASLIERSGSLLSLELACASPLTVVRGGASVKSDLSLTYLALIPHLPTPLSPVAPFLPICVHTQTTLRELDLPH
jgi:hypothetical protein